MALNGLQKKLIAVNAVLGSFAALIVFLRLWARKIQRLPLRADDFVIAFVLVIAVILCAISIYGSATGYIGTNVLAMPIERFATFSKVLFIDVILTQTCFGLIKISILLFYKRIFVLKRFNMVANILICVCVGFILVMIFGEVAAEKPTDRWWNFPAGYSPFANNHFQFDYTAWGTIMAGVNMLLDLIVLILPLPVIKQLKMSKSKKISLVAIFATGFFCVIASAIRLYWCVILLRVIKFQISPLHITDAFNWNNTWANIEVCSSIIAACLPTLVPLLRPTGNVLSGLGHTLSSGFASLRSKMATSSSSQYNFETLSPSAHVSTEKNSKHPATENITSWSVGERSMHNSPTDVPSDHVIHIDQSYGYTRET